LEPAQHVTRFIGLASVNNTNKQKWLYAFSCTPMRELSRDELVAQPDNSTEFPYMEILKVCIFSENLKNSGFIRNSDFFKNSDF